MARTYDVTNKQRAIANWFANELMGQLMSRSFGAASALGGVADALVELTAEAVSTAVAFVNYLAGRVASGEPAETATIEADPTFIGFESRYFEIVRPEPDGGGCAAVGRWSEDALCDFADTWQIGWQLAYTGYFDIVFSKTLGMGTVATSAGATVPMPEDAAYVEWMIAFGARQGCDVIDRCWLDHFSAGNCNPGLGDLQCNEMSLGYCPAEADVMFAAMACNCTPP